MSRERSHVKKGSVILQGTGVSPGIVIGKALVVEEKPDVVFCFRVGDDDLDKEIDRFEQALESTRQDLEALKRRMASAYTIGHSWLLESQLLMIGDELLTHRTREIIRTEKINVEWALQKVLGSFKKRFKDVGDEYFRERYEDIQDVGKRLLHHLSAREPIKIPTNADDAIVLVAENLSPSEAVQLDKRNIRGIAIDSGSRTSHTSIIAKSLEIPSVVGLHDVSRKTESGDTVILDGTEGIVVINPTETQLKKFRERKRTQELFRKRLLESPELPAVTRDGRAISIKANVEFPWEIESAIAHGAEGVGLYRTEFLFMDRRGDPPTEEEHFDVYRKIGEQVAPHTAVIRTFDLGGDKFSEILGGQQTPEPNPLLGLRAIRYCLKRKDIFRTQLRAILRAGARGNLKLLFPLVSSVDELRQAREILEDVKAELRTAGVPFDEKMPVGVMIEVPAAAAIADLLAREVDFFSLGTNDLIQYFLAIDRSNEDVSYLYQPLHPGVLRTLRFVVQSAREAGISVAICGEMAAEPLYAFFLAGMGLTEFSMNPGSIPQIKYLIRSIDFRKAQETFKKIMSFATAGEVEEFLRRRIQRGFPRDVKMLFKEQG